MANAPKPRVRMTMRGGRLAPVKAKYEGASSGARMSGKGTVATGPNGALANSLPMLQARSRHAIRNNAYAQGAQESYVSNLVGKGIRPDWNNPDIQRIWDIWVRQCDADGTDSFYGLQSLAALSQFESGEMLTRFRYRRTSDGLIVPLQLQLMEPDHLDPSFSRSEKNRMIRMGIEFNKIGQRKAYHLWKYHPSERLTAGINQRVRVSSSNILHMFRKKRPGQLRGVPELTAVIVRLYELDEMQDAMLVRQKLGQLFGTFVKRKTIAPDEDDEPEWGSAGSHVSMPGETEPLNEFVPGGIHFLEDDEEVQFSAPPDIGASYAAWIRSELLAVARGAGVTYEQLTGDLKGVNLSSIRAGLLEFRRRAEALQANLIVQQWCNPIAAKFLDLAVATGAIDLPDYWDSREDYLSITWIAPKWRWIDPLKDATADLIDVRAGFEPRSGKAAERGWTLQALDDAIAEGNQSADDKELILDSDPRKTSKSGVIQAALQLLEEIDEEEEDNVE